jgi:hypothetical protein
LISLDHDLAWPVDKGGISAGGYPGTGREVVEHLARFPCLCPVIVHTSNAEARPGMMRALNEARWVCAAVTPGEGETWIATEWREQIEVFTARGLIF